MFRPLWTEQILSEVERTLIVKRGLAPAKARRRVQMMSRAFPDALVEGYEDLIPAMTNDPKDRHVLAAAVRSGAGVIVTANLKDFPTASTKRYEIEAVHPDANSTLIPVPYWSACNSSAATTPTRRCPSLSSTNGSCPRSLGSRRLRSR